jgi:transposase
MNVGEELVSAYLQQVLRCDFTQQNLYTIDAQGEIDVVGLNLKDRSVYICEVAIHLTTGLQYTHAKRPNNVKKLTEKFSRDIEYTRKYLPDFKAHYMLWSPVVKSRKSESLYDQTEHLKQVHKNIQDQFSEDLQLIVNAEFSKRVEQLREKARGTSADMKSPVMRMLQIEGQLAKYVSKNGV